MISLAIFCSLEFWTYSQCVFSKQLCFLYDDALAPVYWRYRSIIMQHRMNSTWYHRHVTWQFPYRQRSGWGASGRRSDVAQLVQSELGYILPLNTFNAFSIRGKSNDYHSVNFRGSDVGTSQLGNHFRWRSPPRGMAFRIFHNILALYIYFIIFNRLVISKLSRFQWRQVAIV